LVILHSLYEKIKQSLKKTMFLYTIYTVTHSAAPQAQRAARTRIIYSYLRGKLSENTQKPQFTVKKVLSLFFSILL